MRVLIVGAGMSGLCLGLKLKRAGIPFRILEKSPQLGGTWWENTYPGCACDIPSHLYGYSFEPNPEWSRVFPPQPEIQAYVLAFAEKHGLVESIRFGTTVREARYDEGAQLWRLTTAADEVYEAEVYVSAVGALHEPKYPDLPGRDAFDGAAFHTARWDASVDLRGKRVGVIGNAGSAVQLVPHVAEQAERLYVFQRTAHWILPKADYPYPAWLRRMFRALPLLLLLYRWFIWARLEVLYLLTFSKGSLGSGYLRRLTRQHLHAAVDDPALRETLTPRYQPGCKRILLTNDYYPALARENVELVTDPLRRIDPAGPVGEARDYPVDVLIYATGFDPLAWGQLEVYGREGRHLGSEWGQSPGAHLGMTVPGYPNYFLLLGPNTGLGHNSVMWMVECQVNYVVQCLQALRRSSGSTLEVREEALERYYAEISEQLGRSVWSTCQSWYRNEDGIFALWPGTTTRYWWRTRRPNLHRDFKFS